MHGNHLKQMLIGGGVALAVLLLLRVPIGQAPPLAVGLACPLMMIFMMRSMGGQGGHGGCDHGEQQASRGDPAHVGRGVPASTLDPADADAAAGDDPLAVRR